ncbi:hypothetical protein A2721_00250 [Candidatus Gottesmanbacteria bacterium RIFCSPHIGHO2_01_FULL_47_48]|uniref:ATP citrate synthase n=1 Tax=Candidatus Gottesmanbacteria bacterium RIFCSPHIGHO2_01_FULL_47_48 TaxID=1798381 RepID=A0A1F6A3H3_9BACT|nr:MAG: hypothetical protein A2721_00250 [Candidatus Gottesmanbacteria bacterium RIFCSPHIGHO2_01_FULL_47_48]
MIDSFQSLLVGGDQARKVAARIGEFDYSCGLPFSVAGFVNPSSPARFQLVNCGYDWYDVPVYRSLDEVFKSDTKFTLAHGVSKSGPRIEDVDSAAILYNAKHVLFWVQECLKHLQIKKITLLAEDVPERDAREIVYLQKKSGVNILGPSSLGMLIPGRGRLGEIGGDWNNLQKCKLDVHGLVGVITKSGGISGELMWVVSQNCPGMSGVFQIGGDAFPATDFVHWLEYFSHDGETKVVVMAGEAGGNLEERAAEWYRDYQKEKGEGGREKFKLIAVISGKFLEQMPKGQKFGHAGAKQEESGFGSAGHGLNPAS